MYVKIVGGEYRKRAEGRIYPVVALYFGATIEALVDVEWFPSAPLGIPERDYQLIDDRLSRHWHYSICVPATPEANGRPTIIAFKEWADDPAFYERLVNGDPRARSVWDHRRSQIVIEYANPQISRRSIRLSDQWVECVSCGHVNEDNGLDEMVRCESCLIVQVMR